MLYMIVSTHTPDTCPIVNPTSMQKMVSANQRMAEVSKALGITVQGSWTDMPAHTIFMLVDAPKPEVLGQMAMELHLIDWNTSVIHPVITMQDAMSRAQLHKE
jgi:hypothetical protein